MLAHLTSSLVRYPQLYQLLAKLLDTYRLLLSLLMIFYMIILITTKVKIKHYYNLINHFFNWLWFLKMRYLNLRFNVRKSLMRYVFFPPLANFALSAHNCKSYLFISIQPISPLSITIGKSKLFVSYCNCKYLI